MKIPVIIDTDPGVDDFFAFIVAKANPAIDIKAITTVAGNHILDIVSENAKNIAELLDIDAVVAKGAEKPLVIKLEIGDYIHGDNGIGGVVLAKSQRTFDSRHAWDVIYDEAIKEKGNLRIVAIGPLTNIAIALLKYPKLKNLLAGITMMGGSAKWGNMSPYSEFNIYVDPHAASVVFKSGVPIDMIGLDITQQCIFTIDEYREVFSKKNRLSRIIDEMLSHMDRSCKKFGLPGAAMHDALAVATISDNNVVEFMNSYTAVECTSPLSYGQTVVFSNDFNRINKKSENNANVAVSVDVDRYKRILTESYGYFK